jgi:hypothetical protein
MQVLKAWSQANRWPRVLDCIEARTRGELLYHAGHVDPRPSSQASGWTVRRNVQEIQSSAICGERKQTPRIRVSHRQHPKPCAQWKPDACLGCKRSRVQIPAARPIYPADFKTIIFLSGVFALALASILRLAVFWLLSITSPIASFHRVAAASLSAGRACE